MTEKVEAMMKDYQKALKYVITLLIQSLDLLLSAEEGMMGGIIHFRANISAWMGKLTFTNTTSIGLTAGYQRN